MIDKYIEDQAFEGVDYSSTPMAMGHYEVCSFVHCNFAHSDLSGIHFTECTFRDCDLSMANIMETSFKSVTFKDCKMLGLQFEECNDFLFAVGFDHCLLNISNFCKINLKGTRFKKCSLQEVDFTEADLSGAFLDECDLSGAIFDHTNLEKADLRTATHYTIHPENNRIRKAKFSVSGLPGLLGSFDIEIE